MSKQEFFKALQYADWYYAMSDDSDIFYRGQRGVSQLKHIGNNDEELKPMLDAFTDYIAGLRDKPTPEEFGL